MLRTLYSLHFRADTVFPFAEAMQNLGTEWLIDAHGCRAAALQDVAVLQALFQQIIVELNLRPVGEAVWHRFPAAGGVTGFVLLAESHLTCHTWPERGAIALNLYCCRAEPACEWPWQERLQAMFAAQHVSVRAVERGGREACEDEKETHS